MQDWKMEDLDNKRTFKNDWPCNNLEEAVAQEETPAMTQNNAADMCEVCLLALHRVPALHWYGVAIRGFAHHAPTL